jgi:hypothetical protein
VEVEVMIADVQIGMHWMLFMPVCYFVQETEAFCLQFLDFVLVKQTSTHVFMQTLSNIL